MLKTIGAKKAAAALAFVTAMSGCEVPVMIAAENNDAELSGLTSITFPASLLMNVSGNDEVIYSGEMIGYISGAADISLASADGRTCAGNMSSEGSGQLNCDGVVVEMVRAPDERTSMSGTVYRSGVVAGTGYAAVFGWGRGAQEGVLRQSMAAQRSFGGAEARDAAS